MRNESGFTLIEIIVSLVLVGMMAAIAGMGIVTGTKGYLLAKENSHMAQKAQLAMARIQRELMELTEIAARGPSFIIYDNTTGRHAIARDNTTIKMYNLTHDAIALQGDGDILVDNVNNFTLDYFQGANAWDGENIQLLSAIQADLALDRSDGAGNTVTFTTTVNPRNTNNYGGVPPDTTPYTAHNYSCFVATATYGDFKPPTMLLLSLSIVTVVFFILLSLNHKTGKLEGLEVWKLKNLSASWPPSLLASQPPNLSAVLLRQNKGNVLIGLIVTMMIFAALGAGMVAMTGTSTSSQVTANTTSKAYYLAESGFRYAASEYLNAADILPPNGEIEDDRNRVLITLHGAPEFTLSNTDERFDLHIFSYYFIANGDHSAGSTTINTGFAGAMPAGFSVPPANNGRLRIGTDIYTYGSYNVNNGQFANLTPVLSEDIDDNMNILPVGIPSGAATINRGGILTLVNASFFPAITGKFIINGIAYKYDTKNGDTLRNITDANHPAQNFTISVNSGTNVVLKPYLRIFSTGTVGQVPLAASRQIIYNVPIPDSPTEGTKVEFYDQFETTTAWKGSTWGTHAIQDIDGNVLRVTDTDDVSGAPKASLIGLEWQNTDANLASAHSLSGHFLSYDAQVKVGFVPPFTPGSWSDGNEEGNGPDGLPKYYAAGLSFRLDESKNSYGVSFLRGSTFTEPLPDNNDNAIVPHDQIPMIVLWQQIDSGTDRSWLAYSFGTNEFSDAMESGTGAWTADIPWDHTIADSHSSDTSWTDSPGGPYNDSVNASLTTPLVDLTGAPSAVLTFWHKHDFDTGDYGRVEILTNGGPWIQLTNDYTGIQNAWEKVVEYISLPPSGPVSIRIRFRINTNIGGPADGWYIDDVTIHRGFPVNESTLLVRIKEAVQIPFNSSGTTAIEDGDIITQANGARGTVVGNPILSAGSWGAGNAVGIITINNVSGTFNNGQLLVGGSNLATSTGFTARNNYIKVFYGDVIGNLPANNDPFDHQRNPNYRNEIHWPPDELENGFWPAPDPADHDFFTLVRWDAVNTDNLSTVDIVPSAYETGAIILSDESSLFTPDSGILSYARPELGLHTFGHGSTNVYFDDFAIQLEIASGAGFLTPIQE